MATYVNESSKAQDASATTIVSDAQNVTTGNHLYVTFSCEGGTNPNSTITDSVGSNSWTKLTGIAASNGDQWMEHWYCANVNGNANFQVTLTHGGNSVPYRSILVRQYTGGAFTFIDDETVNQPGGTTATTAGIVAAGAGVTAAYCKVYAAGSFSLGTNMAQLIVPAGGGNDVAAGSHRIFGSSGTYGTESVFSANSNMIAVAALFEDAGGGGSITGTGAVTLGAATVAGTGEVTNTGTGAIALGAVTVAGTGERSVTDTGSPVEIVLGAIQVSGSSSTNHTGTGAISLGAVVVAGTGEISNTGTSAIALGAIAVSGTGERVVTGTGAITLGPLAVSGSDPRTVSGTGGITLGAITVQAVVSLPDASVSGGGWLIAMNAHDERRRKRKRELEAIEDEQERIEDEASREIAKLLQAQERKDAERKDIERIKQLVKRYPKVDASEVGSERVLTAIRNAQEKMSRANLERLQKEFQRMVDEEDEFMSLILMLIDE